MPLSGEVLPLDIQDGQQCSCIVRSASKRLQELVTAEMIRVEVCLAPGSDAAVAANTSYEMLMLYHAVEIRL